MIRETEQGIRPIQAKSTGAESLKSTGLRRCAGVILCLGSAMSGLSLEAQSVQDLQNEIQQMKQLYEQRIASLEGRIASLEQTNLSVARATAENVISAKNLPSEVAKEVTAQSQPKLTNDQRTEVEQTQLGTTPYYDEIQDSLKVVDELQQQVKAFEFHGYLRSGVGLNSEGGQMVAFQAPGAPAKYRLGNEAETYGEFIFVNNWINPGHDTDKAWMKTEVMLQANTTQSQSYASNDQFRLREAFVQVGDVLPSQPAMDFWAGERYYRRQNIDINDFFVLDTSGYGGGFENLNLKFAQAAVAYLGGAKDDLITDNGAYPKSVLDARLYGIKLLGGDLGLWYDYSFSKGGLLNNSTQVPSEAGWAIGIGHLKQEWAGGFNRVSFQYGTGNAANFSTSIFEPTVHLPNAKTFRFTDSAVIQPNNHFAMQPIFIYQSQTDGNPANGTNTWVSFGARPVWFFTEHISLAFEAGFDHTQSGLDLYDGWLRKYTIAPQIGAGRKFFSRPVLRAFLTYANWSQGLKGFVGVPVFTNKTSGWDFGLQGETWW